MRRLTRPMRRPTTPTQRQQRDVIAWTPPLPEALAFEEAAGSCRQPLFLVRGSIWMRYLSSLLPPRRWRSPAAGRRKPTGNTVNIDASRDRRGFRHQRRHRDRRRDRRRRQHGRRRRSSTSMTKAMTATAAIVRAIGRQRRPKAPRTCNISSATRAGRPQPAAATPTTGASDPTPMLRAARRPCAPAASAASAAAPSPARSPPRSPPRASAQSIGWTRKWAKSQLSSSAGSIPGCGQTSFSSSPRRWTTSVPALGLMHSQSIPGAAASVPLLSTAIRNPRACSASISASSSCSIGSPPVITTSRSSASLAPQRCDMVGQRARHRRTCRRPARRCRRNRCRRNCIARVARSCSRPLHKLQPAKRRNTARLPACTPSPCSVRKASLTA